MRAPILALVILLAGCAGMAGPTMDALPDAVVTPLQILCPSQSYAPAQVCAAPLGIEGDWWGEPYVAAHPERAGVFVIGVQGYGADDVDPGPVPGSGIQETRTPRCSGFASCLFITEDHGAQWRLVEVGSGDLGADPVIGFVGDNMLVSALTNSGGRTSIKVYSSPDLGITWSSTELGAALKTDRPWFNVHNLEVMMVWQTGGKQEGWWSLSQDGGKSWGPVGELPCNLHSTPQYVEGWITACSSARGTTVYRLDGSGAAAAIIPESGGTRMMDQGPAGHLWITVPGGNTAYRSDTYGQTWVGPFDIGAGLDRSGWSSGWVYWAEAPPTGGLLVLLTGAEDLCVGGCPAGGAMPVYLAHLDHDGQVLWTHQLFDGGSTPSGRPVQPQEDRMLGEFGGIACQPDRCLIAWMAGGGVDFTWLVPA